MNRFKISGFIGNNYKTLILLNLLFLIVLDLFVILQRPLDLSDGVSSTWWMIIKNVETGNGYKACEAAYIPNCDITDQTTAIREPLPVFVFALVGKITNDLPIAFQLSQLVFNVLICLFVFLLGQEFGSRTLGLIASVIWAFYLPVLHAILTVNGDLMAGFFVVSGLLYFIRAVKSGKLKHWMFLGVLFGLAVLSRSSAALIFIPLVVGSTIYLWKTDALPTHGGWYSPLLAIVMFGLVVSPWVVRNEIVFGRPFWGTTLVGYNLYRHNVIVASGTLPHYVGPDEAYDELEKLVARTPELRTPMNEAQVDIVFRREARKLIFSNFGEYIGLVVFRFLPLWFNIGVRDQYGQTMKLLDYLIIVQQILLLIAFLLAIWRGDWRLRLLALCILFFMIAYLAVGSQLRYMIPVMPVIGLMSAIGIHSIFPLMGPDN